jgi:hypothetical protein
VGVLVGVCVGACDFGGGDLWVRRGAGGGMSAYEHEVRDSFIVHRRSKVLTIVATKAQTDPMVQIQLS